MGVSVFNLFGLTLTVWLLFKQSLFLKLIAHRQDVILEPFNSLLYFLRIKRLRGGQLIKNLTVCNVVQDVAVVLDEHLFVATLVLKPLHEGLLK
jgi:hypothetical protein